MLYSKQKEPYTYLICRDLPVTKEPIHRSNKKKVLVHYKEMISLILVYCRGGKVTLPQGFGHTTSDDNVPVATRCHPGVSLGSQTGVYVTASGSPPNRFICCCVRSEELKS